MNPKDFTVVVVDTIPNQIIYGITFGEDRCGIRPVFYKQDKTGIPFYQAQIFIQLMAYNTNKVLYEFRTATDFQYKGNLTDSFFYESIHAFTITAIEGFNWHLNRKSSPAINKKRYSPVPTLEQNKEAIRKAYMFAEFDSFPGNN